MGDVVNILFVLSMVFCLSGCAGVFETMNRDPVRVEKIAANKRDKIATVALNAEKRNVIVALTAQEDGVYKFCAEPPPEVAKTVDIEEINKVAAKAALSPEKSAEVNAELQRRIDESLFILAKRSVALEVYRTGTYALCQFYLNGAIEKTELAKQFDILTAGTLKALAQTETK